MNGIKKKAKTIQLLNPDNIFLKEVLNQIMFILFYIKVFGNVTPHPNKNICFFKDVMNTKFAFKF